MQTFYSCVRKLKTDLQQSNALPFDFSPNLDPVGMSTFRMHPWFSTTRDRVWLHRHGGSQHILPEVPQSELLTFPFNGKRGRNDNNQSQKIGEEHVVDT